MITLSVVFAVITFCVMTVGIIFMGFSKNLSMKYGNKLMVARVIAQAIAILLAAAAYFIFKKP